MLAIYINTLMHALDLNSGLTSSSHGSDIAGNEKNRGKKGENGKNWAEKPL